uniref:Uncharacterized protein n=1 Tax=Gasterosteus aculeatus TaxID=69293 RepID=G3PXX8_GASAC
MATIPPVREQHLGRLAARTSLSPQLLLLGYHRAARRGPGCVRGLQLPPWLRDEASAQQPPPPLLLPPRPGPPALLLPRHLETLQEEVPGVLVQLQVPPVEPQDPALGLVGDVDAGGARAVELREGRDELQVEGALEQILGLTLVLSQPEKGHAAQVALGALHEQCPALVLVHGGDVVAAHQAEIGQHAGLPVVGQVVGAVHELLQGATRPVVSRVAARQLGQCRRASVAHVQGGPPRGAALHVTPLAQVARYWVS